MRSAPHPPCGAVAGPDPDSEPFALLDFALGCALDGEGEQGHLDEVLARYVAASGGRAALLLRLPPGREPGVLAAFPSSAAAPALVNAVSRLLARHLVPGAEGGCAEGPLALPRQPAGARGPDWAVIQPARLLAACASPGSRFPAYALVLVTAGPSTRQLRSTARALLAVLAAQQARADGNAEIAERRAVSLALVDASPDAVVISDAAGRIVSFNPAAERLTGFRAADALGRDPAQLLIPERYRARYRSGRASWLASVAQGGNHGAGPARAHLTVLRADGTEWLAEVTSLLFEVRGEMYFCRFLRDVTELERAMIAERSLAGQTERLNSLIAAAIPGVLLTDEHGMIVQLNESLGRLVGIPEPPAELAGTSGQRLLERVARTFADPARVTAEMSQRAARREPAGDLRFDCADGRVLECDYWPVLAGGRYRGGLWLLWDVSARASAEQEREGRLAAELAARRAAERGQQALSRQNDQLRELDEVKTRFLAQMSHELRAPLSSIVSYAALLRDEDAGLTATGSRHLDVIERSAGRVLRMVGDLLLLSRIEAGVFPLDLAPVALPGLVAEAVSMAAPDAAARGVTLELSPDGAGPELLADRHRLLQVLDNLIGNAVKFTDRGGQVRAGAEHSDGAWRIEVADSGIGIPPDELGRLFDRFYRASNAERTGRPGSGLGLAVVKEVVELHGGRVGVASTPGRGTTVTAWLPLRPPGQPHPT